MPKLDVEIPFLESLAQLLQKTGLSEIEIVQGTTRVRVARQLAASIEVPTVVQHAPPSPTAALPPAAEPPTAASELNHPGLVKSPMVGTVYLAPEPDAPPFVSVGEQVREGQTLLIIEAMKVMNAIRAPRGGRLVKVLVQNASPVEYGEPLMIIE
jgi:acetyl-CoA carboxylase biotin carboxyl carrier protein